MAAAAAATAAAACVAIDMAPSLLILLPLLLLYVELFEDIALCWFICNLVLLEGRSKDLGVLLASGIRDILAPDTADNSVIEADPLTTILPANINGVVATARVFAVVVYHSGETVFGQTATVSGNNVPTMRGENFLGKL